MAKKPAKATPKHVEPESMEPLGGGQEGHGFASGDISKSEAVRRALAEGYEGPQEGTAYIRKEFGIEIAPGHFSAVKATEKKKAEAGPKGKPGRKPREVAESAQAAPAPKQAPPAGDMIDDLVAVKQLVQKLGAEQVRKIVGLFE